MISPTVSRDLGGDLGGGAAVVRHAPEPVRSANLGAPGCPGRPRSRDSTEWPASEPFCEVSLLKPTGAVARLAAGLAP
eukprot:1902888-Pyramimonas_sp.AAC.1